MVISFIHLLIHTYCFPGNGQQDSPRVTADTKIKSLDTKKVTSSDLKTSDDSAEKVEQVLLVIVIKTYFGAVVVKRCDVSTCYDRSLSYFDSWSHEQYIPYRYY